MQAATGFFLAAQEYAMMEAALDGGTSYAAYVWCVRVRVRVPVCVAGTRPGSVGAVDCWES